MWSLLIAKKTQMHLFNIMQLQKPKIISIYKEKWRCKHIYG